MLIPVNSVQYRTSQISHNGLYIPFNLVATFLDDRNMIVSDGVLNIERNLRLPWEANGWVEKCKDLHVSGQSITSTQNRTRP